METKLTEKEQISLLAQKVRFAISHLDCKGDGIVYDMKKGECKGHWTREFAKALRECGYDCDDDCVDYAKTPHSKRKGKAWKELCAKITAKGYKI